MLHVPSQCNAVNINSEVETGRITFGILNIQKYTSYAIHRFYKHRDKRNWFRVSTA